MQYNYFRKVGHCVNQFTINGNTYSIRLTEHGEMRLKQRQIDMFLVISSILSLGEKRITEYRNTNRDIMVIDKQNNFSIVCTIENNCIYLITVIDKVDVYVKSNTEIVNL